MCKTVTNCRPLTSYSHISSFYVSKYQLINIILDLAFWCLKKTCRLMKDYLQHYLQLVSIVDTAYLPNMSSETGMRRMSPVNSHVVCLASMPDVPSNTCEEKNNIYILSVLKTHTYVICVDFFTHLMFHCWSTCSLTDDLVCICIVLCIFFAVCAYIFFLDRHFLENVCNIYVPALCQHYIYL